MVHLIKEQCRDTNPKVIDKLFKRLNDPQFLSDLDGQEVYNDASTPGNLLNVLQCLAENENHQVVSNGFMQLNASQLYDRNEMHSTLRRNALIIASGNFLQPSNSLLSFLENEVIISGEKRSIAVAALSKIGTHESLEILSKHVFNPQTSVINENLREIYLPNYTLELAEFRDKIPVMSFLLDQLYKSDVRTQVLLCLTENRIERGPEHVSHIIAAPLNKETTNSENLTKIIAQWLISNVGELEQDQFLSISMRIPELLGVEKALPPPQSSEGIKEWTKDLVEQALSKTTDPSIKQNLQNILSALQ